MRNRTHTGVGPGVDEGRVVFKHVVLKLYIYIRLKWYFKKGCSPFSPHTLLYLSSHGGDFIKPVLPVGSLWNRCPLPTRCAALCQARGLCSALRSSLHSPHPRPLQHQRFVSETRLATLDVLSTHQDERTRKQGGAPGCLLSCFG